MAKLHYEDVLGDMPTIVTPPAEGIEITGTRPDPSASSPGLIVVAIARKRSYFDDPEAKKAVKAVADDKLGSCGFNVGNDDISLMDPYGVPVKDEDYNKPVKPGSYWQRSFRFLRNI